MSIITKSPVSKGVPSQFSLSKQELLLLPTISSNAYFSDTSNWYRVNVVYKSSPGTQYEIVEFDATQETPTGNFLVSERARDLFQVQKLIVLDFDGGYVEVPRSELEASEFDVDLAAPVVLARFSQVFKSNVFTVNNDGLTVFNSSSTGVYNHSAYLIEPILEGKKYLELTVENFTGSFVQTSFIGGFISDNQPSTVSQISNGYLSSKERNSIAWLYGSSYGGGMVGSSATIVASKGDIIMVAVDMEARKVWFGKNGIWMFLENPSNGFGGISFSSKSGSGFYVGFGTQAAASSEGVTINTELEYLPEGFTPL